MTQNGVKSFTGRGRRFLEPTAYLAVFGVGLVDYLTGPQLSFSLLYLPPIFLVAWFKSRWHGIAVSVLAAIVWLAADLTAGQDYAHALIPYWNATVRLGFFTIVSLLVWRLRRALDRADELSGVDFLTGVPNGRSLFDFANLEIERARRYKLPLSIVYIDLDNFKHINDSFGHLVGDALLRSVAAAVRTGCRVTDFVARLGGDEFVILLPQTDLVQCEEVTRRIQGKLSEAMQRKNWPITFSLGAATFLRPPESVQEMVKRADDLMYSVKNSGKNAIKHEVCGGP